jgi:hypothetical protein
MRAGRGRSLARTIEDLNPLLRGWINYFRFTESKWVLEELDATLADVDEFALTISRSATGSLKTT